MPDTETYDTPEKRNIAIFLVALPATWGLLWVASHNSIGWALIAAWAFALVNHTPFSLMYEAVHGVFSKNQLRNHIFGTLCSPALPTSFTLQEIAHLGYHCHPRAPWVYLPELMDPEQPQPIFWRICFRLWGGARPAPPMGAPATLEFC